MLLQDDAGMNLKDFSGTLKSRRVFRNLWSFFAKIIRKEEKLHHVNEI